MKDKHYVFPNFYNNNTGVTLLDFFATQALIGLITVRSSLDIPKTISKEAYKLAEAMMEERENHEE